MAMLTLAVMPAPADETSPALAGPEKIYTGTVIAVHPNEQTLHVNGWLMRKDFHIGSSCAFVLWNKPAGELTDLRAGEKVAVSYQDANGVLVADRVEQKMSTEKGVVTAIGTHQITVRTYGANTTFQLADDCKVVLRGNHSGLISDVQPGNLVTVIYDMPNGQVTAALIAQTSATFTGALTAIDLDAKTLKAKSLFETKAFTVGSECAIIVNGKMGEQLSELMLNEKMVITYDDVDGVNVVNRIETVPTNQ